MASTLKFFIYTAVVWETIILLGFSINGKEEKTTEELAQEAFFARLSSQQNSPVFA